MKEKLLSILAICFIFVSIFTMSGCGEITLKGGPLSTDAVTGNGSLAVRKGDYLYFVNGYVSNTTLSGSDNDYGVAKNGAIYRAKLDNGKLIYDIKEVDGEEIKTLKNVELLVPKIAGFEYTNLYIFGNTLYFTSPNTEKDDTGAKRFDLTDVYAVSIKGGEIKKLANALNITSKDSIVFSKSNNNVFLTYISDNNLYNVKISGTKKVSTVKIDNVSSFAVSNVETEQNFVYYTRSIKEGENTITGNVLAKLDVQKGEEVILYRDNVNTYSVKDVKNGKIYYTKTNSLITNAYIYSKNIENFYMSDEIQYTVVAYTSTQYIVDLGAGYNNGVLVNENNALMLLTGINNPETDIINLYNGTFTMLGVYGENIYGKDTDGNLVRINIQTKELETLVEKSDSLKLDNSSNFDYENGYVYYYTKYTGENDESGYYLNRTYINSQDKETELIGVVLDKHLKLEE